MQVELIPHPSHTSVPDIQLRVEVAKSNTSLSLEYQLQGNIDSLIIPLTRPDPKRLILLWEHLCFEAFIALDSSPHYWELNAAPSGDWNFFFLSDYRKDVMQESQVQKIHIESELIRSQSYKAMITLDMSKLLKKTDSLRLGLTSVIETQDGSKTYWALKHPTPQPNFHHRESFTLKI